MCKECGGIGGQVGTLLVVIEMSEENTEEQIVNWDFREWHRIFNLQ